VIIMKKGSFCLECGCGIEEKYTWCAQCAVRMKKENRQAMQTQAEKEKQAEALKTAPRCTDCDRLAGTYRACPACPDKQDERSAAVKKYTDDARHGKWTPHGFRDNIYRDGCVGAIDAHHGSDLPAFIKSLQRIRASDVEWLLPSHGPIFRKRDALLDSTIERLERYTHMADFGTCAIDWPLMDEWEREIAEGKLPT